MSDVFNTLDRVKRDLVDAGLRAGMLRGGDLDHMEVNVPVSAGDAIGITRGYVHEVSGGLFLDLTYRRWDGDGVMVEEVPLGAVLARFAAVTVGAMVEQYRARR